MLLITHRTPMQWHLAVFLVQMVFLNSKLSLSSGTGASHAEYSSLGTLPRTPMNNSPPVSEITVESKFSF